MKSFRNFCILLILITISGILCSKKIEQDFLIPKDYRLWKKAYADVLDYPVPGHGDTIRVIYANEKAFQAKIVEDKYYNSRVIFPDGAIIIKEVYKNRNDINMAEPELTIMKKDSIHQDALDDWIYYLAKPGEKFAKPIKGRMCIGCHEAANDKHPYFTGNPRGIFCDYVFIGIAKK